MPEQSQTTPESLFARAAGIVGGVGVALLFIAASVQKIWGVDIWWQMAAGRWILANRQFPVHDVLSYSATDHPWIEVRWVFCVLVHLGWEWGGPTLLIVGQTLVLGFVWLSCLWPAGRRWRSGAVLTLLALGIASGMSRWVLRPELCSFAMLAGFVGILEAGAPAGRTPARRWLLWLLPVLQVLWTNTHTLFALGPVLVWIWTIARGLQAARAGGARGALDARLLGAAFLTTAACWINPYGHAGATFPILLFTQIQPGHVVSRTIGEMTPLFGMPWSQWTLDIRLAPVLLAACVGTFVWNRAAFSLPRLAVVLACAYLGVSAQRNVALFAIVACGAGIRNVSEALAGGVWGPRLAAAPGRVVCGAASMLLAWFVATDRFAVSIDAPREFGVGVVWWNTPRGAVERLADRAHPLAGPVFNAIRDGGYIAWAAQDERAQGVKVFSDGRLEVYGPEFLEALTGLGPATWPAMEARWGFNTAVVPISGNEALVGMLAASPAWRLVYFDHRDVIFTKAAEATRLDPNAPFVVPAQPELPAWKSAMGGVSRPWMSEGYAQAFLALGALDNARLAIEAGLGISPENPRLLGALAPLVWREGDEARAREIISKLPEARQITALAEAARLLAGKGRTDQAIRALEQACSLAPEDRELALMLADTCFLSKDFEGAGRAYTRVLEIKPGAVEFAKLGTVRDQLGDLAGAAKAYQSSLQMNDAQPAIWNMLGGVEARAGDIAGAEKCFERAVQLKPDFSAARNNLEKARSLRK